MYLIYYIFFLGTKSHLLYHLYMSTFLLLTVKQFVSVFCGPLHGLVCFIENDVTRKLFESQSDKCLHNLKTYLMSLPLLLRLKQTHRVFFLDSFDLGLKSTLFQGLSGEPEGPLAPAGLSPDDPESLISLFPQEAWPERPQSTYGQIYAPATELHQTILQ